MNTQQVANRLVELCRKGENMKAIEELYDTNIVSHEMPGMPNEKIEGKEAVIQKSVAWNDGIQDFHSSAISDPVIAGDHFTCKMTFDCTFKEQGRVQMEELSTYKVANGKIVNEQFFYEMPQG